MSEKSELKRYSLRWSAEIHELAEKASVIKGHDTIKSYLIELVEKDARKTIEDYGTIKLSNEEFDRFVSYFEKVKDIEIPDDFMRNRDDNDPQ